MGYAVSPINYKLLEAALRPAVIGELNSRRVFHDLFLMKVVRALLGGLRNLAVVRWLEQYTDICHYYSSCPVCLLRNGSDKQQMSR